MNIVLCGFMGSGKTVVGKELAKIMGRRFVDTDQLVEARSGVSIPAIFQVHGEDYFRELERAACAEAAEIPNCVISTGGGALTFDENVRTLRTTGKTLCVVGDGYTLNVSGKEVKSTTSEIDTAITFTESAEGLEFELDNGRTLPCAVQLELDVSTYSRLYLYNTISNKWQFLNSYKDGVITADTAGRYLLTNQNLRFGDINWTFFIAGGVVVILIAIAYIVLKKRYWFW